MGSLDEVIQAFNYMAANPHSPMPIHAQHFKILERYTVALYDKTSHSGSINEARRELFCQKELSVLSDVSIQVQFLTKKLLGDPDC